MQNKRVDAEFSSASTTSAVTLSGVSPKSPYGFFASAQNDKHRSIRLCELYEAIQSQTTVVK